MKKLIATLVILFTMGAMLTITGCSQPAEEEVTNETTAAGGEASSSGEGAKPVGTEPVPE